jgi:hypothetical protein
MKVVLVTILAGILATTTRVIFLELISKLRAVHVDMIKAVGTLYHGEYGHPLLRGLGAHYFFGIISAFIYLLLLGTIQPSTILSSAGFGALIGFFHGCVVSFTLTVVVDEDHPIHQFRTYGYEVVLYHWIAQILYGIVLGIVVGTVHPRLF